MRMSSLNCIARYCIEFSSLILLLVTLLLLHGMGDATFTKQVNINSDNPNTLTNKHLDFNEIDAYENDNSGLNSDNILRFTPDSIDFGKTEIGKPIIETVHVHNAHDKKRIQMISISDSDNDNLDINLQNINKSPFYCSFIDKTILEPRSNTTITVAFLAKHEGLVNNTLFVRSNIGLSKLQVYGYGESSQFRVRPLIGGKISLNSTFSSLIYLYNPFPTSIQLTEVYSSGANLKLEMLDDDENNDKNQDDDKNSQKSISNHWNIPPYEYRPVMKTNFVGKIVSNHSSFIRIRLNSTEKTQLILPVEIEVCSDPDLYLTTNLFDFGIVVQDFYNIVSNHIFQIEVFNTDKKDFTIKSIEFEKYNQSHAIEIRHEKFDKIIKPNQSQPVLIGLLILNISKLKCFGLCTGKILISTFESDKKLQLDYIYRSYNGGLFVPDASRIYFSRNLPVDDPKSKGYHSRLLTVTNIFDFPIILNDISFPIISNFKFRKVENFSLEQKSEVILKSGDSFSIGEVEFNLKNPSIFVGFLMKIKTNLTDIPLQIVWNVNPVRIFVPGKFESLKGVWDLGAVLKNETITKYFLLMNDCENGLKIGSFKSEKNDLSIKYLGSVDSNIITASSAAMKDNIEELKRKVVKNKFDKNLFDSLNSYTDLIESKHFGVFEVVIKPLSLNGDYFTTISISSSVGMVEFISKFTNNDYKIVSSKIVLGKTFPGKVVSTFINIKSFNTVPIRIKRISLETNDKRFKIDVPPGYIIQPGDNNDVKVTFDPSAICPPLVCYSSLDIEKEVGHFWLLGHGVYSDTAYIDKELYKLIRNQWMTHSETDLAPVANFRFHTDGHGSFNAVVQAQLHWPRLSNKFSLKFPPLRVGRKIIKDILIENPADKAIIVQAVHVSNYPNADVLIQMMKSIIFNKQWPTSEMDSAEKTILDSNNLSAFSFASSQNHKVFENNRVYEWLGIKPSPESFTMLLQPGSRQRLSIVFRPLVERNFTSLLILRNNLTVLEVVVLRGEGGIGLLKIDNNLLNDSSGLNNVPSKNSILPHSSPGLHDSKIMFQFTKSEFDQLCQTNNNNDQDKAINDDKIGFKNNFLIHQRFRATNIGRMTLNIRHYFIDSMPCEGYGFQIKNCQPIKLLPNQSFELEMTYSPDFTQTKIKHNLFILLDDEFTQWQRFDLLVNIPSNYLSSCLAALPRPAWEAYVGRCLFMITTFLIVLTIFVAYTDATKLVSGYVFALNNTEIKNQDISSQNIEYEYDNKNISDRLSSSNVVDNQKTQNNCKLKHRKNTAKTFTNNVPQSIKSKQRNDANLKNDLINNHKSNICDDDFRKMKLNHQNSSSSENELSENLSTSDANSSNHQSTESLCDISSSSRKNSIDEQTVISNKESSKQVSDNVSKKRKNKIDHKKVDNKKLIHKKINNNDSMKSLFFPPIEEFESMMKTRSATHPGNNRKIDDKKKKNNDFKIGDNSKKRNNNESSSIRTPSLSPVSNDSSKSFKATSSDYSINKSSWNFEKTFTDIWKQPSDLNVDILGLDENNLIKPRNEGFSSATSLNDDKWIVGDWSNDFVNKPKQNNRLSSNDFVLKHDQSPGYFGLRFNSECLSPTSFMSSLESDDGLKYSRPISPLNSNKNSWINSNNLAKRSVWDENTYSARTSRSSTLPFSPVIAPPKSTSPSANVQQIQQQDQYFQKRTTAQSHHKSMKPFVDSLSSASSSRMGFNDFMNCKTFPNLNHTQQQPISKIAPPPGFGSSNNPTTTSRIDNTFFEFTALSNNITNSIWNSNDNTNLEQSWPTNLNDPTNDLWNPNLSFNDLWSVQDDKIDNSDFLSSAWSFNSSSFNDCTSLVQQNKQKISSFQQFTPNLVSPSPSPSSSSSSNGQNNN